MGTRWQKVEGFILRGLCLMSYVLCKEWECGVWVRSESQPALLVPCPAFSIMLYVPVMAQALALQR